MIDQSWGADSLTEDYGSAAPADSSSHIHVAVEASGKAGHTKVLSSLCARLYTMNISAIMQPTRVGPRQTALRAAPRASAVHTPGPCLLSQYQGFRRTNVVDGLGRRGPAVSWEAAVGRSLRRPRTAAKSVRVTKMMFERFTEKAIKVVMLAQEEARRLGHNFVGTEQVLLGLIGESTGIAAKVLKSMGVTLKDARVEVEKIIGRGSGFVAVEIPFTPRAKRVLELSLEEARQLGKERRVFRGGNGLDIMVATGSVLPAIAAQLSTVVTPRPASAHLSPPRLLT